jgi:hypothetical protein
VVVPVRLLLACFKEKPQCYHQSSAELFELKASIRSLPTQRRQVHCRVSARVNSKDRQSLILYVRLFSKELRGAKRSVSARTVPPAGHGAKRSI